LFELDIADNLSKVIKEKSSMQMNQKTSRWLVF
jgi:hypothetical protein